MIDQLIGLTSARNVEFTKKLGLYDQVYTYEELNKVMMIMLNDGR